MCNNWMPTSKIIVFLSAVCVFGGTAFTQEADLVSKAESSDAPKSQKKSDSAIIYDQILERVTPENISVVITLSSQRAQLKVGEETAIDAPVSTGRRAGWTPKGSFMIVQKEINHRSTVY